IGAGLFAVALKPAPQPAPIPQAEPVAVATASVTGPSEPVIVWYDSAGGGEGSYGEQYYTLFRAWSDGTIEAKYVMSVADRETAGNQPCAIGRTSNCGNASSDPYLTLDWFVISSAQMACRTDINGDGEVELGDLLAVLSQWGDQATCPDTVQLQCGLGLPNG
ncbi:MAG: hypothetical protein CMJ37_02015, partial [Phycisphaerae bacterium]|nr:hypothetical protein [Phycisphaerae bacterium]